MRDYAALNKFAQWVATNHATKIDDLATILLFGVVGIAAVG